MSGSNTDDDEEEEEEQEDREVEIARLFAQAETDQCERRRKQLAAATPEEEKNEEDNDDNDEDNDNDPKKKSVTPKGAASASSKKRSLKPSSRGNITKYEKLKTRMQRRKNNADGDDASSSSSEEDDEDQENIVLATASTTTSCQKTIQNDDSDEDQEDSKMGALLRMKMEVLAQQRQQLCASYKPGGRRKSRGPSVSELRRHGIAVPDGTALRLAQLHEAKTILLQQEEQQQKQLELQCLALQYGPQQMMVQQDAGGIYTIVPDTSSHTNNSPMNNPHHHGNLIVPSIHDTNLAAAPLAPEMFFLKINTTLHRDAFVTTKTAGATNNTNGAKKVVVHPPFVVTVPETTQWQHVAEKIVQTLQLKPTQTRVVLSHQGKVLKKFFGVHHYPAIPKHNGIIDATIHHSTDLGLSCSLRDASAAAATRRGSNGFHAAKPEQQQEEEVSENTGQLIAIQLQRHIQVGTKVTVDKVQMVVGTGEPWKFLVERYATAQNLSPNTHVFLTFEGDPLNLECTPASVEVDDGDLIDVSIGASVQSRPSYGAVQQQQQHEKQPVVAAVRPNQGRGKSIAIQFQRPVIVNGKPDVDRKSMTAGCHETFQSLSDRYVRLMGIPPQSTTTMTQTIATFQFEGEPVSLQSTPAHLLMDDGDLIDVELKTVVAAPSSPLAPGATAPTRLVSSSSSAANPAPPKNRGQRMNLTLQRKIIQQGKSTLEKTKLTIGSLEPFHALVERYSTAKKLGSTQIVSLIFEGVAVNLHSTPASLEMDDDDLLDVRVTDV